MSKLTKETYYQDSRVSNSSLNWILPECGGSAKKYTEFSLFPSEQEDTESMRLGSLLHKYMEAKSMNVFQVTNTPSAAMVRIAESVVDNLPNFGSQPPNVVEEEVLKVARFNNYHDDWKDATLVKNLMSNIGLFMLNLAGARETGKVLISEEENTLLLAAGEQLRKEIPWNFDSKVIPPGCEEGEKWEIFNEKIIEFEIMGIPCKSMIDLLLVNYSKKRLRIFDLKTTSTPLSIYLGYKTHQLVDDLHPESKLYTRTLKEVEVPGTYLKWNVHRQMAFYNRAVSFEFPEYAFIEHPTIIACETKKPFEVRSFLLSYDALAVGDARVLTGINLLQETGLVGVGL